MPADVIPPKEAKPYVKSNKNNAGFDAATMLESITDTDLTAIFGISGSTALELLSEIGFDMNKWPTVKHITSWLNLGT